MTEGANQKEGLRGRKTRRGNKQFPSSHREVHYNTVAVLYRTVLCCRIRGCKVLRCSACPYYAKPVITERPSRSATQSHHEKNQQAPTSS